jgi:precorrin-8X/cobalt-precorrin-8 methylmutase
VTQLFDCYVAVDWSAANQPVAGKDSIWLSALWREAGCSHALCENIRTRAGAMKRIEDVLSHGLAEGRRILCGFDFGFGYPKGFAQELTGTPSWRGVWQRLSEDVEDDAQNRSNRFALAASYNRALGEPRFWGRPHQHRHLEDDLPAKRPVQAAGRDRRIVEGLVPRAKSLFQLAYNGAVGSQSLLGIARLERLRRRLGGIAVCRVWPFETDFADTLPYGPSVVLAEIYPTLFLERTEPGSVKDRQQVRAVTTACAAWDRKRQLTELLSPPPGTSREERRIMATEEGSILGAGVLP